MPKANFCGVQNDVERKEPNTFPSSFTFDSLLEAFRFQVGLEGVFLQRFSGTRFSQLLDRLRKDFWKFWRAFFEHFPDNVNFANFVSRFSGKHFVEGSGLQNSMENPPQMEPDFEGVPRSPFLWIWNYFGTSLGNKKPLTNYKKQFFVLGCALGAEINSQSRFPRVAPAESPGSLGMI